MSKHNFNRNFAIIIGINNYENGIRKLETAEPDARKLAEIIKKQHQDLKDKYQKENRYEVRLLLDEDADFDKLKQLIEDFKQEKITLDNEKVTVNKDDRLLFYFAGHGIALDALENQEGPVGYLIPQDATSGDSSTYLPMQDLHDALTALPCRHMLAILDCCFAGAFRWASLKREIVPKVKVYKESYDRFISDAAWQVITSGADDQTVVDSLGLRGREEENHSPFAKALFDALCGKDADFNKDDIITATELYLYLRDRVDRPENRYKRQTPGLYPLRKQDKGEFIFLLPDFDRDKLDDAPELNPENNPYRGLQPYDEEHSHLYFGRENLIKKLYQKVVDHKKTFKDLRLNTIPIIWLLLRQYNCLAGILFIRKQAFTVVLGASGTGKSSLMKAGLLARLRNPQEHQFKILDPMRPGESPLKSLAKVFLPITNEKAAQTILVIKRLSEELKKKKQDFENLIKKYNKSNPELLQVVERLTLRYDLLDIEHLKFTDKLQQSLQDIFSNNNHTEKQLVNRWINKFNQRKQLNEELRKPIEDLSNKLKQETYLTTIIENWSISHSNTKLLLPVDQFEELITLCKSDEERKQFQKLILNAIAKYPDKIHIVITLRLDFEAQFQNSILKDYWNDDTRFVVPPMTQDELREVIEKPALEKVLYFQPPSLVDELINEVVQMPGALPLLSFTLSELYLKYSGDRTRNKRALTKKDYEELGRVVGSITKRANQEYEKLVGDLRLNTIPIIWLLLRQYNCMAGILFICKSLAEDSAYKDTVRRVMLRMISLQGGELARRQVSKDELVYPDQDENNRVEKVLKRFSQARLIVEGSNSQGEPYVEPAHDALVLGWDKLLEWKKQEEENLILQRRLTPAAEEWKNIEQSPSKAETLINFLDKGLNLVDNFFSATKNQFTQLLRQNSQEEEQKSLKKSRFLWDTNPRLNLLEEVLNSSDNWFSETEAKFVQSSINQSRRKTARGRIIAISVIMGSLIFSAAIWMQLQRTQLREKAAIANNLLVSEPVEGLVMAIQAIGQNQERLPKEILYPVQNSLLNAIEFARESHRLGDEVTQDPWNSIYSAISCNGNYIVAGDDEGEIKIWNLEGNLIETWDAHDSHIESITTYCQKNDEEIIVSGAADNTLRFWNMQGQSISKPIHLKSELSVPSSISVSSDGKYIVISDWDQIMQLLDRQGNSICEKDSITTVALSPDEKNIIVTGDTNGILRLWDLQCNLIGQSPQKVHDSSISSVTFSSDGQTIVSGGEDGTLRLWDLQKKSLTMPFRGHEDEVTSVAISQDGQNIISASFDGTLRLWNRRGNPIGRPFIGHKFRVLSVALSPNGKTIVSSGVDGTVRLWNTKNGLSSDSFKFIENDLYQENYNQVKSLAISQDGKTIVAGYSVESTEDGITGVIRLWDLQGNPLSKPFQGHEGEVTSVAISPDGQTIISGSWDKTIRLWDLKGNPLTTPFQWHQEVTTVAISPDGKTIVSGSPYKKIQLWDLQGNSIGQPFTHEDPVNALAISQNGKMIVSGVGTWPQIDPDSKGTVWLWDFQGNRLAPPFLGHENAVNSVGFSLDSKIIVSGSDDGTLRLWNLRGEPINRFYKGNLTSVTSVAISPNGKIIASGSTDQKIRLWDLEGNPIGQPFIENGGVMSIIFSPNGKNIISGSNDGSVRLWQADWKSWLNLACDRLKKHSILVIPNTEIHKNAGTTCKKYVWNDVETSNFLVNQGLALALKENIDEKVIAKLKQAKKLNPSLNLAELQTEARRLANFSSNNE